MMRKTLALVVTVWLLASGCGAASQASQEPALPDVESQPAGTTSETPTNTPAETMQPQPAEPALVDFGALEPEAAPDNGHDSEGEGEDGMEAPAPGERDPGAHLATIARQALADRLGASVDDVTVESVEEVTWPDSALGCPEPGMMYLQVLTPGYRIVLFAEGTEYTYHTDRGERMVLCGEDGQPLD